MKIRRVRMNNRKGQLEITASSSKVYPFPYAKLDPRPGPKDKVREAFVDRELGREAVTYVLESGKEGSVHVDQALEYNQDPRYLSEMLAYKLNLEAKKRIARSGLSRRELARRLGTSVSQLYRLLDPTNVHKGLGQLVTLLRLLDCDVELVVREKGAT